MTSPLFVDPAAHEEPPDHENPQSLPRDLSSRLSHLEEEVGELRDTIARFAELVLGEVKELRHSSAVPALPAPAPGDQLPPQMASDFSERITVPHTLSNESPSARRPWLLVELLNDLSGTFHMCFDPRYGVRRATRVMVPLILLLFGANYFFFRNLFALPILSTVLEKVVDIVLAILLYKVVSRETARYRQAIRELVAWQQSHVRVGAVVVGGDPPTTRLDTQ
jgi:hypothetical protein